MKVVEVDIVVEEGGKIEGQAPPGTAPGKYKATLAIGNAYGDNVSKREPLDIPVIEVDFWPENFSTHRKDLYGD